MLLSSYTSGLREAGVDEVGRGCLAGAVVAAAVIFPKAYRNAQIKDSKSLSRGQREKLEKEIKQEALAYAVAEISPEQIDKTNILRATFAAMHAAVAKLCPVAEFLLVDGHAFDPYPNTPSVCVVKGDTKYLSIAAASILAKTYRDRKMRELAKHFPAYGWETNVGYPTKAHREAIGTHGITPHHRKSFRLLPDTAKAQKIPAKSGNIVSGA